MGNIPETLDDLAEVADEEAEEIGEGRDEIDAQVPVTVATPDDEIIDHPRLKRKKGRPPVLRHVEVQTPIQQPESEEEQAAPAEPDEMRGQSSKRKEDEPAQDRFKKLTKKVKFYRKRERDSSGEAHGTHRRPKPTWMQLLDSDDSDSIATIIQITQDSDVPIRGTAGAAAYDVRAKSSTKLPPQTVTKVPLKLQMAVPAGNFVLLAGRSGLAASGIYTHNGIIDSDFRGEVSALLHNSTDRSVQIQRGQRVAQAVILPVIPGQWQRADHLPETERGAHGFGSSGML